MICDSWDVVIVPFPFTEKLEAKRRPALVLSTKTFNDNGHLVLSMITTKTHAAWPGDINITSLSAAGLHSPCIVRLKVFTLDKRLIIRRSGHLAETDRKNVTQSLRRYVSPFV